MSVRHLWVAEKVSNFGAASLVNKLKVLSDGVIVGQSHVVSWDSYLANV